jgi:hypothetical protein
MDKQGTTGLEADLEDLYLRFLHAFYEDDDREQSLLIAERLEAELASRPDFAESIRGDEIRSLLAELRGDFASAIHNRREEIRKIRELHSLVQGTPGWAYVFRQYDFRDISDRLDLLAVLHTHLDDYPEAVKVLNESKAFCASHEIPFDGEDLLEEFVAIARDSSEVEGESAVFK